MAPTLVRPARALATLALAFLLAPALLAQAARPDDDALIREHAWGGRPACDDFHVRIGYLLCYDSEHRVGKWVAYHIHPEYLEGPERSGRFSSFRKDPDTENGVVKNDYTNSGYARGHLAPYGVMGGDRDNDNLGAEEDEDDAMTVFEANYMSNMTPQHQTGFNGASGIWFEVERFIQDDLVAKGGQEVWIYAGSIFGHGPPEKIGPDGDIGVPPLLYKIVIRPNDVGEAPDVLAFLLPHHRTAHGDPADFLVSVDVLESLTGLDFFSELDHALEEELERTDTFEFWTRFSSPAKE